MKTMKLLPLLAALALCGGCATQYVSNEDVYLGDADKLTQSEKKTMASEALEQFQNDPTFTRVYNKKKAALEKKAAEKGEEPELPLIASSPIKNLMRDVDSNGNRISDRRATGQLSRDIQTLLRQTGLFDVVDKLATPDILDQLMKGENEEGESGGLENFGAYHAPDLWLTGELRKERDGRIYTYTLNLELTDTATKRVFWSNTVERRKK